MTLLIEGRIALQHEYKNVTGESPGTGVERKMKRLTSICFATVALLAWLPSAAAEIEDKGVQPAEEEREATAVRNDVSPFLIAGNSEGVGGGLQLDGSVFALRGSFGYGPVLALIDDSEAGGDVRLDLLNTYQVNADALLFFWAPSSASRIGFSGGYRYNSVLGQGASWGLQAEADVAEHTTLMLSVSAAYFPDGPRRARETLGNPDGRVTFAGRARYFSGVGLGVRFPI